MKRKKIYLVSFIVGFMLGLILNDKGRKIYGDMQ